MDRKAKKSYAEAQNPLILRCHRLMEAFAKSDEDRDFYLDKVEGFIFFVDLDKTEKELKSLGKELANNPGRYCLIPKLTFYETKKFMEGFVNEKIYDIDTKDKLLDIIQSKDARENFLEFIYDHHSDLEKWQQYYQERSRIRIIEWLRNYNFLFVFEEDLDLATNVLENLKDNLFVKRVGKDVQATRKILATKSKTYYSNEALNPRPKRGRPPKQTPKIEVEPQISTDIYKSVPSTVRSFLFTPEITSAAEVTFSAKFETAEALLAHSRAHEVGEEMEDLTKKMATLKSLSTRWMEQEARKETALPSKPKKVAKAIVPARRKSVAKPKTKPKRKLKRTPKKRIIKTTTKAKPKDKPKAKKKITKKTPTKKKILLRRTKRRRS